MPTKASAAAAAHVCGDCGYSAPKWFGRCPVCGGWASSIARAAGSARAEVSSLDGPVAEPQRFSTGIPECDRVLGGGIVPGAVVLLAGEPGIGKSTLVLQLIDGVVRGGHSALLVTGEESLGQVSLRARRLALPTHRFRALATTSLEATVSAASSENPDLLVVDSVQTLSGVEGATATGSPSQVRECAAALVRHAKETDAAMILVGHVTKEGGVAGPKALEHIVDVVTSLEGERTGAVRLLRAAKNRFGSCDETGVFMMTERGLEAVPDPSAMMLADRRIGVPGSIVFCGIEGTRPVLVEIQAMVSSSTHSQPRRIAIGLDGRRLTLSTGVLGSRAHVKLDGKDVYAASAGGLVIREPAADLAVCLAVLSAFHQQAIAPGIVAIGEVGLGGEIRRVPALERRLGEAARLGFMTAVVPPASGRIPPDMRAIEASDVVSAFAAVQSASAMGA
jgi:DNA repair protein RadA/Sms